MGLFITFEGTEGSGKSTQAQILYQGLQARGYPVILTREPGGTHIGEMIRRVVVDLHHTEMSADTEILLFSAARAQLVSEIIRPYLDMGGIVLCDRYADSTLAYQGYGLQHNLDDLHFITRMATGGLMPDRTFYLDLPAEEGLERKWLAKQSHKSQRTSEPALPAALGELANLPGHGKPEWNRLDARDLSYHQRVTDGFQQLMLQDPARWCRLDARLGIENIARSIETLVEPLLARVQPLEA